MKILLALILALSFQLNAQNKLGKSAIRYTYANGGVGIPNKGLLYLYDFKGQALQTVASLKNSNTLTAGPTGGVDVDEPVFNANWITFNAAGSATKLNGTDIATNAQWTWIVVAKLINNHNGILVSKWDTGDNPNREFLFYLGQDSANDKPNCATFQSDGTGVFVGPADITQTNGVWSAWACTGDGSTIKVYKNTTVSATTGSYNGTVRNGTSIMAAAGFSGLSDANYVLNGSIAFIAMYNRALSQPEINKTYKVLKKRLAQNGISLP